MKTFLSHRPTAKNILVGFISLWLLILVFCLNNDFLSANGHQVYQEHQWWRAFTTTLVHADPGHLGSNAFFFTGLAILLNTYFGWIAFPLVSFIAGGLINLIALKIYPPEMTIVGISGVIYFMASFWLVAYVLIERRLSITRRLINTFAMTLIFFFPEVFDIKVSYLAHGLGFLFGIPVGLLAYFLKKKEIRSQEIWVEKKPEIILEEESQGVTLDPPFSNQHH